MAREPPYLGTRDPCNQVPANEFTHMGHSIRTAEWRYTEWPRWTGAAPDWTRIDGIELYDHRDDDGGRFDSHELVNVAGDPQHAALVKRAARRKKAIERRSDLGRPAVPDDVHIKAMAVGRNDVPLQ